MLGAILLLGLTLRVLSALYSTGFDHPNEVYRILEPIAFFQGYSTRLPWEWTQGLLSTLPARAHFEVLRAASGVGIESAHAQAIFLRVIYGVLGVLPIAASFKLVRWARGSEKIALFTALFVAVWPEFIYRSVRLMDYSLEASLLAGALLLIPFGAWASGFILGLLFFVRFQSGLYFLAIAILLAASKKNRKLVFFILGYGLTILIAALYEARGFHGFLSPFFHYIHFNWTENGAAKFYGSQPWHRYLSECAKAYGIFPFVLFVGLFLSRKMDWKLGFLFLFPFLAYSLISHKEGRFIFGFAWLLVPAAFLALSRIQLKKTAKWALSAIFLVGFVFQTDRISRRFLVRAKLVSEFERVGETLQKDFSNHPWPLVVETDPDFSPGAFFLRYKGPLCYIKCERTPPNFLLLRRKPRGDWELSLQRR